MEHNNAQHTAAVSGGLIHSMMEDPSAGKKVLLMFNTLSVRCEENQYLNGIPYYCV